jgi:nicotinamidase/pyrazinamidase
MTEMPYGPQVLWPDHCVQGTAGAAFHADLDTTPARLIVRKGMRPELDSYSAFQENDRKTPTGLSGFLSGIGVRRVFCVGLATDFCVFYSAMDARGLGLDVVLVEDACRGIDLDGSLPRALAEMAAAGVVTTRSATVAAR